MFDLLGKARLSCHSPPAGRLIQGKNDEFFFFHGWKLQSTIKNIPSKN
jgi:hypothetical protein